MADNRSTSVDEEMLRREQVAAEDVLEARAHGLHVGGNHAKSPTTIEGWTGGEIDFLNPAPTSIRLADVARGLSLVVRFACQVNFPVSVAEHSMLVLDLLVNERPNASVADRQYAILHDGHEAYSGDLTAPLKRALELLAGADVVRQVEAGLDKAILTALGVPIPSRELRLEVKRHDLRARFCEGRKVKPREATWDTPDCTLPDGVECAFGLYWVDAEELFLKRCAQLGITEVLA